MVEIHARAPLRISLAGGGSDLPEHYSQHGCELLAAAVNQYVEVRLAVAPGGVTVDDESLLTTDGVADLPPSLTRCVLRHFKISDGITVRVRSSCPPGSGLGWSGALTVALVGAASAWRGHRPSAQEVAAMAFAIERHEFGSPVGQQDQWAAALGGVLRLRIDRAGSATAHREPALENALSALLDRCLLLFRTPLRRSAAEILSKQVDRLSPDRPTTAATTAMAVITGLVEPFSQALADQDAAELGRLLHTHWQAKVSVSPAASTPAIDAWYHTARSTGATGGKIIGAGGGGHLILACLPERVVDVVDVLREAGLHRIPIRLDRRGLVVRQVGPPG